MAISSDQPISAANLKAVVEKLMGGGYLPETILAVCAYSTNNSICYIGDEQSYSRFYVEVGNESHVADTAYKGYFDSGKRGSVTLEDKSGETTSISLSTTADGIRAAASYGEAFYRIIGYR